MRLARLGLMGSAAAIVATFVVVGCRGEAVELAPDTDEARESGGGSVLPPSGNPYDSGTSASTDGGKDAGPPAPIPGAACTTQDVTASRSCAKCGKQETICKPVDGGLEWTDYGACNSDVGACEPGTTRSCGNCGTQTCSNSCGWGSCTQPANSCSPGSVEFTAVNCPSGAFRSRTCEATCGWPSFTAACAAPKPVELWSGGAAAHSTFMRSSDGNIYAWGSDYDGQLGDSSTINKKKMTPTPISNVVSMNVAGDANNYGFACASFLNKSAKCWGYLSPTFTLGDGLTPASSTGVTPTGFGTNVVQMVGGYAHACGLFVDGSAKCWGFNAYGQLGNATTTTATSPVTVNLSNITRLSSGFYTGCALRGDAAHCWGFNAFGQIGDGTKANKSTPTLVIPSGVASLAPGYSHSCAAMTNGTAKCWGQATNGEIGDGTASIVDVTSPRTVVGIDGVGLSLGGVADICTGYGTSCARLTDGRVACWGRNSDGQLGVGDAALAQSNVPKVVSGVAGATALVCGYGHACVIQSDGHVKCWGDNENGQIGNGAMMPIDAFAAQETTF